jgi:subtilisin family serine protease
VVGVIDSGVDYNHPELAGAIWRNPKELAGDGVDNDGNGYVDDIYGWNFVSNNNNPMDDNGHGTHVAGTIAAAGDNGVGVAGVANAKILPLKFLSATGSGSTSAAIAAINYATKLRQSGVNLVITNNSWGGGGYSTALYDAIKAHGNAGIMFVAAAGNGGSDQIGDDNDRSPQYPASYDLANIVSVAATDHHDVLASFSNFGAASVDLAAPGVSILSTVPGGYGYSSGTSMAAPHVAGAAALAWSYSPGASVAQVRSALFNSVDKISGLNGKMVTGGRVNAHGTLLQLSRPTAPTALSASAISTSEITISWTDNSGNESGFRIERSTNGVDFTTLTTVGANVTSFRDTGLAASTSYTYRVAAVNSNGASGYSNTAGATTTAALTIPSAPANLAARAVSTSQINLTWSDNSSNETGFRIERSTDGRSWSQIATVGADVTSFSSTGLKKNTTYHFRVRAYNGAGNSTYSSTASAKTFSNNSTSTNSIKSAGVFSTQLVQLDEQRQDELSAVLA